MKYPTHTQVTEADQRQLCIWHRFLRSPENDDEVKIKNYIFKRWSDGGGFTPHLSKSIGWDDIYN